MRVEFASSTAGLGAGRPSVAAVMPRRRRIDPFELGLLAVFAIVSVWVLGLDLWQVIVNGRDWTGTDGVYLVDQMQYLAWIRDASHHLLASNLFVLRNTPADYFQPAIVVSGGLSAIGVPTWLSLLLWKPVAVLGFFFVVREYVHRSLTGLWQRRAALTLALFFGSFTVIYGSVSVIGDMFPGFLSWGYVFGLIALAAMAGALVFYERAQAVARVAWVPGLLGAFASSLHPWNGELLIVIIIGAELLLGTRREITRQRVKLLVLTIGLTAAPLLYYVLLGRTDQSWALARDASKHAFSFWSIALAIAPLALPSIAAYFRRPKNFLEAATRSWPIAALIVFILSATAVGATPLHAFQGITIPLSVLAVEGLLMIGWRRLPGRVVIGAAAVAAFTIPATVQELKFARQLAAPTPENPNFITKDEHHALNYLAKTPDRGGVLTRSYLGALIPAKTGRRTFVGDCLWSQPGCYDRVGIAQQLFAGTLPTGQARTFVQQSGARFVLADCETTADLGHVLAPFNPTIHRFGCASVYELNAPSSPDGPLAESAPNAAVRAKRG